MTEWIERRDMSLVKNQLLLQDITRWHIVPTVSHQTVADHTCGVIVISLKICSFLPGFIDCYDVLLAALSHDLNEVGFGDVPSRVTDHSDVESLTKWRATSLNDKIIKIADMLEMAFTLERIAPTERGLFIHDRLIKRCVFLLEDGILALSGLSDSGRSHFNKIVLDGVKAIIAEKWDWSVGK